MARNQPGLNIVGLGSQDNLDQANQFVAAGGTVSFPMLWDESGASWAALGVFGQPYWILYDSQGTIAASRSGSVDITLVESLL